MEEVNEQAGTYSEEKFDVVRAQNLPLATIISDNDMLLVVQGGYLKRALPSAMKGKKGDAGLSAYLGVTATYIQWKQGATGAWQNLLEIERLRGPKGEKPIFQKINGCLMVKYEGQPDSAFVNIFDREELKMKFSDLTPAEVNLLKLHFADLTAGDKAELMKPATDAAARADAKIVQISKDVNLITDDLTTFGNTAKTAETGRVNAESARATAETGRVNIEKARVQEEAKRVAVEGTRVLKETERNKTFGDKIQEVSTATGKANTAAGEANTAKTETLAIKVATETVKTDTLKVKQDTLLAKAATETATANAKSVSDHPGYIGTDYHVYTWNYATGAYNKTDTVLRPEGFSIFKQYTSITLMNADKANVPEGKFVLVNTNNVEQADNAKLYVKGAVNFDYLVDMSGAIGFTGKTPQITIGTVTVGSTASASLSSDGTDTSGNPKFKLNLVIIAGPQGLMPVIEMGAVTTGLPGTNVSATLVLNGKTADGRDKYLLNMAIPRGTPGLGSGNVTVPGTGLIAGKKYLFVPSSNGSTEGIFTEFNLADFAPAGYEFLFVKKV